MQRLQGPVFANQLAREPVEQFGMAGPVAQFPEIRRSPDEWPVEMLLPDPIDDDPGSEGVIRPRQPTGEGGPASRGTPSWIEFRGGTVRRDDPQKGRCQFAPGTPKITPNHEMAGSVFC